MPESTTLGAVSEFAASQHGVVTRSQAAALGIHRNLVARLASQGFWFEPTPGVLVVNAVPTSWLQRVAIAAHSLNLPPVPSHATAARLHELDGFVSDDRIVVTVVRGQRLRVSGASGHQVHSRVPAADIALVDGIRCTTMARTIVDLASVESADAVERAIDDFERRGLSLRWLEMTAERLRRPGHGGSRVVLASIARRRTRGRVRGSWFQKLVLECLASPVLVGLVEEFEIYSATGEFLARVDLAFPAVRLGVEAHSRRFHFGARPEQFDQERENRLAAEGWDVSYVGYSDVTRTPTQVRAQIEQLVLRRRTDLRAA
jgi:hypothetical protein